MFVDFLSSVISNDIDNTYVEVLFFITSKESEDFLDLTQYRIQTGIFINSIFVYL